MNWTGSDLERVTACPVCGGAPGPPIHPPIADPMRPGSARRWEFRGCTACGSAFLDPRPTPEAIHRAYHTDYVTHGPPPDPTAPVRGPARVRRGLLNGYLNARLGYHASPAWRVGALVVPLAPWGPGMATRLVRGVPAAAPGARLLDVGCANGVYLTQMAALGWEVEGVETDPAAIAFARAAGVRVTEGNLGPQTPADTFDAVTLGHVIEHLHDPRAILAECRRVLRPGGTLWVATPNLDAPGHRRYGADYVQLDPPRHLVLFTQRSLRGLLRTAGFTDPVLQPAVPQARAWTFHRSHTMRLGLGSHPDPLPPPPASLMARALLADAIAMARPGRGEEIVISVRAPGGTRDR